jgi:hypothetical protein
LQYEVKNGSSSVLSKSELQRRKEAREQSRVMNLLRKGPTQFKIGNLLLNAADMHIPVFGTQTSRFGNSHASGRGVSIYIYTNNF